MICRRTFTFHYVSIKSIVVVSASAYVFAFTFHYVSIKSSANAQRLLCGLHLHSTMYLLNQVKRKNYGMADSIYIPLCIY